MPSPARLLSTWSLDPVPLALALIAGLAYGWASVRARQWPARRTIAFAGGLGALVLALESGLDRWADELLSIHMLQHLVLMLVVPPLLLAGRPLALALRTLDPPAGRRLARLAGRGIGRALGNPVLAFGSFTVVTGVFHLPAVYGAAVSHPALHDLEHLLFLGAGLVFWWPLVDGELGARRRLGAVGSLLYVMLAMAPMGFFGATLEQSRQVVYPHYAATSQALGVSPLADQSRAGAFMWVGGSVFMAAAALLAAWLALAREERRARTREAYEDAGRSGPPGRVPG